MSPRRRAAVPLAARIEALAEATELLDGIAPAVDVSAARDVLAQWTARTSGSKAHLRA